MAGPCLDAALAKFPFLVANEHRSFDQWAGWNQVGIVHLESHHLQLVLDIAGENQLEPIEFFGKEVEPITFIDVPRHLLTEIRDVADSALPIDQAGHCVTLALRRFDDRSPIMVGDVVESKPNAMVRQDVPDRDAEWGPGKLDEGEHGTYMTDAK